MGVILGMKKCRNEEMVVVAKKEKEGGDLYLEAQYIFFILTTR